MAFNEQIPVLDLRTHRHYKFFGLTKPKDDKKKTVAEGDEEEEEEESEETNNSAAPPPPQTYFLSSRSVVVATKKPADCLHCADVPVDEESGLSIVETQEEEEDVVGPMTGHSGLKRKQARK